MTEGAGLVNLYNKDSKYIYVKLINRHTGEKKSREEEFLNEFEEETWTKPKCRSIVNNAFSSDEKQRVKGNKFAITMYIDPDTGKVADVEFIFLLISIHMPLSLYRYIVR